jgi:hypothetical protein
MKEKQTKTENQAESNAPEAIVSPLYKLWTFISLVLAAVLFFTSVFAWFSRMDRPSVKTPHLKLGAFEKVEVIYNTDSQTDINRIFTIRFVPGDYLIFKLTIDEETVTADTLEIYLENIEADQVEIINPSKEPETYYNMADMYKVSLGVLDTETQEYTFSDATTDPTVSDLITAGTSIAPIGSITKSAAAPESEAEFDIFVFRLSFLPPEDITGNEINLLTVKSFSFNTLSYRQIAA